MGESLAESLAKKIADGTYVPSVLDSCQPDLPLDQNAQSVRFVQFVIFANPQQKLNSLSPPEYMIFQQFEFIKSPRPIDKFIGTMAKNLAGELNAGRIPLGKGGPSRQAIPEAGQLSVARLQVVAQELAIPGYHAELPETDLRSLVTNWTNDEKRRRLLDFADPLERAGFVLNEELSGDVTDMAAVLTKILIKVFIPPLYQPFETPYPHFALCVTFEQQWQPEGYTRGELINTISLAPGEQLTLEVNSWDKSTFKSQEELAAETELRASESLTQRDSLTVAREVANQFSTHLNASATIPIHGIPVSFDAGASDTLNTNLKTTREQSNERTVQASNTLKTTRKLSIEVARDTGREQKQTRVIANTNRCHTLNCRYFEILSNYLVTMQLLSIRPCLLLPNPRTAVTACWVLCHEDVLIPSLLDKNFLGGFKAAVLLETYDAFQELKKEAAQAKGVVSDPLDQELGRRVNSILGAFNDLRGACDNVKGAAGSLECKVAAFLGGELGWAVCVAVKVGLTDLRRMVYFAMLYANQVTINALNQLAQDNSVAGARHAEMLRTFFAAVSPSDFQHSISHSVVSQALQAAGVPGGIVTALIAWNLIDFIPDDAGLYNTVQGAAAGLEQAWAAQASIDITTDPGPALSEVAKARVEFGQLQCHIQANWLHYMQAVWLSEPADQRFLTLQKRGAVASILDNEILGFLGHKAAYPIRDVAVVKRWIDFEKLITAAESALESTNPAPELITLPTPGTVLEAIVGKCDACEEFIQKSRVFDLRTQEAKAREEEAEAKRREMRLEAVPPDLSNPAGTAAENVTVNVTGTGPGTTG